MFEKSKKYEVLAMVDSCETRCVIEHKANGWVIICPTKENNEGWSELLSMTLLTTELEGLQTHKETDMYHSQISLTTDGGNLQRVKRI